MTGAPPAAELVKLSGLIVPELVTICGGWWCFFLII
nr:MAG TPA: hypothetical protein [Bacteriophage sp.]